MAFVLQDVINEIEETRSLDPLKKLKKENLIKVAAHYGITPAVGATRSHILDLIKDHCIENNIIDEVEEKLIAETAEIVRLKLDFEREERRLAHEEAQRAREAAEAEAQKACDAEKALQDAQFVEAEKAQELRLTELKEARELRELELKAEKEKALLAAELEAAAREHELWLVWVNIPLQIKLVPLTLLEILDLWPPSKKRRLINILLILRKLLIV